MSQKPTGQTILVVDDDVGIVGMMETFLSDLGYSPHILMSAEAGLEYLQSSPVDLIIADLRLPGMDGLSFVRAVKEKNFPAEILVITGFGTVQDAVEAIKIGAFDFIEKPLNLDRLEITIQNALQKGKMKDKIAFLERTIKGDHEFSGIIGNAPIIEKAKKLAQQVAGTDAHILISGESGTGKELFARAIHNVSDRSAGPFVAINCGAIAENLLESEMFGHEKGAFTGAVSKRAGHFENAEGGTLFLDEITELPLSLQVKLLRVVQEKEFMRVGSSRPIRTDCRIISATNRNVEEEVAKGAFREDLFYRLNIFELKIPPLRERIEDIPLLVEGFLGKHARRELRVSEEVMAALTGYHWPGNVRELENVVQRAAAVSDGPVVSMHHLPDKLRLETGKKIELDIPDGKSFKQAKDEAVDFFEKEYILKALADNNGNISKSARQMDLPRQTLHILMKKHGISGRDFAK